MKIKVRIAVAANADGEWHGYGYQDAQWEEAMDSFDPLSGEQRFWIEAEIDVAEQPTSVVGTATLIDG